jgi:hypothetical protein
MLHGRAKLTANLGLVAALAGTGTLCCEGNGEEDVASVQDQLGSKPSPQTLKKLARNFHISAAEPLQIETRSGELVEIPLSKLVLELELGPSPVAATASRAPVVVAPMIPAAPARRAQPSAFVADVTCAGVASRVPVPVPTVEVPEVPPDQVPRAVRVPSIVVAPLVEGMPVVATRVRVPAGQVDVPTSAANAHKARKLVAIPAITIGLLDAANPTLATAIEVHVPPRAADEASFQAVRALPSPP